MTISAWNKGRNPRIYFNVPETRGLIGYVELVGGGYNPKYDECEPPRPMVVGDTKTVLAVLDAAREKFREAGFFHDNLGQCIVSDDALLCFFAHNAEKVGLVSFRDRQERDLHRALTHVYTIKEAKGG